MSKNFLTTRQVMAKVGSDSGLTPSDSFASRRACESIGADLKYLTSYGMDQFVVDDDIISAPKFASLILNSIPIPDQNTPIAEYTMSPSLKPGKNWFNMVVEFSFTIGRDAYGTVFRLYADGKAGKGIFISITPIADAGILMDIYTFGGTINGVSTIVDQCVLLNRQIPDRFEGSLSIIYQNGTMWVTFNGVQVYNKDIVFGEDLEVPLLTVGQMKINGGRIGRFTLIEQLR